MNSDVAREATNILIISPIEYLVKFFIYTINFLSKGFKKYKCISSSLRLIQNFIIAHSK